MRYARRQAKLPSLLTTNIENTLGHTAASTSLAGKSELEVDLWRFDSIRTTSTSLVCKSEPEVVFV